ncbi:MAG: metal-dependent transcriptional regulator [Christensenellaceae bacterium]|jgi:Mn-dependent DtxR family transcriptional regulator|nr:metal-dependent transcriptional regulator [Christensenellaceae bacterium]
MKETPERILQVIYKLSLEDELLKSVEIGKRLELSRPDVFHAVKLLKGWGYVAQKRYGKIALTEKGREKAEKMQRIHRGLIQFFSHVVGLSEAESSAAAFSAEHVLSDNAMNKILDALIKYNLTK